MALLRKVAPLECGRMQSDEADDDDDQRGEGLVRRAKQSAGAAAKVIGRRGEGMRDGGKDHLMYRPLSEKSLALVAEALGLSRMVSEGTENICCVCVCVCARARAICVVCVFMRVYVMCVGACACMHDCIHLKCKSMFSCMMVCMPAQHEDTQ